MSNRPLGKRTFSYDEAVDTFPHVRDVTDIAFRQVEAIINRIQSRDEMERRKEEIEAACDRVVQSWAERVVAFGCVVQGLWRVDWDNGAGYYSWRYPEDGLRYFNTYEDGFPGRVPVQ
jgi:hypothetical protein